MAEWNTDKLENWLSERLAEELGLAESQIDPKKPFASYGLDSARAVSLSGELEDLLQLRLEPTLVFEYPTVEKLAAYLCQQVSSE